MSKDALAGRMQRLGIRDVDLEAKLKQMEQAASDPRFLTDMQETMNAFAEVDAEWWEVAR